MSKDIMIAINGPNKINTTPATVKKLIPNIPEMKIGPSSMISTKNKKAKSTSDINVRGNPISPKKNRNIMTKGGTTKI